MGQSSLIIRCLRCGQKNRVDSARLDDNPVCGRCRSPLDHLIIQCFFCGAKNRVSEDKLNSRPICGRCRLPLYPSAAATVSESTFKEDVLDAVGYVIVGFLPSETDEYAQMLNYFASKYVSGIKTLKLMIGANPSLSIQYGASDSPSLLIFNRGEIARRFDSPILRDEIEAYLLDVTRESGEDS